MVTTMSQTDTHAEMHIRGIGIINGVRQRTYWTACGLAQIHPFEMTRKGREQYDNAPGYVDIEMMHTSLDDALDSREPVCMDCYRSSLRSQSEMTDLTCCNCGFPFGAPLVEPILGRPKPVRDDEYPTLCQHCRDEISQAGLDLVDVLMRKGTRTPRVRSDSP